jgi:hypothetical protein
MSEGVPARIKLSTGERVAESTGGTFAGNGFQVIEKDRGRLQRMAIGIDHRVVEVRADFG